MGRAKVDADGVCIDFKNRLCGFCAKLGTVECCRSTPKYQKRIAAWERKLKRIANEVIGIDMASRELRSLRESALSGLYSPDLHVVLDIVNDAQAKPGSGWKFIYNDEMYTCFDCVHCKKPFTVEPCIGCFSDTEIVVNQSGSFRRAINFEPKPIEKDVAVDSLVDKYREVFVSIKKDAVANNVPVGTLLAHLLKSLGTK